MKRFLSISFLALALIISAAGAAPAAHAAYPSCSANNECQPGEACVSGMCVTSQAALDASAQANVQGGLNANGTLTPAQYAATADAQKTPNTLPPNPDVGEGFGKVMTWIMSLFAWLVGVAALALDYAVYYTVVTMGDYVNKLSAVGVTWQIMRDIGNIVLIFGFLAAGITTILNVDWYGGGKKMIPMLLVAAVFLNFSLFIAEAVIDTGNLFATQFYTQIKGGVIPSQASLSQTTIENEGISNKIMAQLGLQTIYTEGRTNTGVFKAGNSWVIGFMGILLFLVTAFVMFSLAFILIARFVILLFLIIVAPIGFAGLAVPKLKGTADKWWSALFEQTITAPVLLLLLYIALAVITDASFLTGICGDGMTCKKNWLGFIEGNNIAGFASMMLSFLVAMGLLLAVVIISKKVSAFGGSMATGLAGKLSFGATAFVGRRTVGRVSNYAARKIRSSSLGRTETGRILAGVADRGAKASFDVRGATAFGGLKGIGIEAGDAQKGGYKGREEELIKARTEYAKSLRQSGSQKEATEAAQKEHDKNMAPLEAEEQARLKMTKEIVNASREELKLKKQELEAARRSGDVNRIQTAEAAYNNDMNTHKELVESEREKLDPIRNKMKEEKEKLEAATASNNVAANQRKYGEALQEKSFLGIPRAPYDWTTAVGSARREAAGKIISDSKKDKSQQQLDRLEAILAKADSGGEERKPKEDKPKE